MIEQYAVTIEETVSETFYVKAGSLDNALALARERYRTGEFVLEPGELVSVAMQARHDESDKETAWVKL